MGPEEEKQEADRTKFRFPYERERHPEDVLAEADQALDRVTDLAVSIRQFIVQEKVYGDDAAKLIEWAKEMIQGTGHILVMGGPGHRLVELMIHLKKSAAIFRRNSSLLLPQSLQNHDIIRRSPLRRLPGAQRLHGQPHLAQLRQVGEIDVGHIKAVSGRNDHQLIMNQQAQGLTHRGETHIKLLGQIQLIDRRAWNQVESSDLLPN